jgi:NAD(P)H-hydrate repair Nnr-like enzyme with NAD(P)H-hydrate dehydratase domain
MKLGVYLHGYVGDRVAEKKGEIGLIASDIIEGLPTGMRAFTL